MALRERRIGIQRAYYLKQRWRVARALSWPPPKGYYFPCKAAKRGQGVVVALRVPARSPIPIIPPHDQPMDFLLALEAPRLPDQAITWAIERQLCSQRRHRSAHFCIVSSPLPR